MSDFSKFFALDDQSRANLLLWLPVFLAGGIVCYFALPFEPRLMLLLLGLLVHILAVIFTRNTAALLAINLCILAFSLGLCLSSMRSATIHNISLHAEYTGQISAQIESITPLEKGSRLIISNIHMAEIAAEHTPIKARLTTRSNVMHLQTGNLISFYGRLNPPPKSLIPGGYNFARSNWYKQIGAVGFNLSKIKLETGLLPVNSWWYHLDNFRLQLSQQIIAVLGPRVGYIATALLIGEYAAIPKDILESMRKSGLTHILSVSGLHLSMVAAIFFFSLRVVLNLYPPVALNFNVKKLAIIGAVLATLAYLLISGRQIAAERAFIMTFVIILAVLLDRIPTPMRSVLAAACFILTFEPEQIINPSFQMSFASVIALFAGYDFFQQQFGKTRYLTRYLFAAIFSSLIAGLATAPYAAYHFHQYSSYSLLANLLSAPLVSLLIMPSVVLCFFATALWFVGFRLMATRYRY